MPVTIGETVIMGDDGKFTDGFSPNLIGEEYAESKAFENTPDIISLTKAYADTKSALGKKLENVIQKPGEGASDQELVDYKAAIRSAAGAPEKVEDYIFTPAEGIEHNEELAKVFKEKFFQHGLAPEVASDLVATWDALQIAMGEQQKAEAAQTFKDEVDEFSKNHPGDNLVTGTRTAAMAILEFADDNLKAKIREAKLLDNITNFEAWNQLGVSPVQLALWENIGKKMKSDTAMSDEGLRTAGDQTEEDKKVALHYNHPTSIADRRARGVAS